MSLKPCHHTYSYLTVGRVNVLKPLEGYGEMSWKINGKKLGQRVMVHSTDEMRHSLQIPPNCNVPDSPLKAKRESYDSFYAYNQWTVPLQD